jgi:plastocyanin
VLSLLLMPACSKPAPSSAPTSTASPGVPSAISGTHVVAAKVPASTDGSPVIVVLDPADGHNVPAPADPPVMNQIGKMFSPEVLFAQVGQPVEFRNDDDTLHNVNVKDDTSKEQLFNVAILEGTVYRYTFARAGLFSVHCDIHQAMFSLVVVSSSPYGKIADPDGSVQFDDVVPGAYTATVYAGTQKLERRVDVAGPRTDLTVKS